MYKRYADDKNVVVESSERDEGLDKKMIEIPKEIGVKVPLLSG